MRCLNSGRTCCTPDGVNRYLLYICELPSCAATCNCSFASCTCAIVPVYYSADPPHIVGHIPEKCCAVFYDNPTENELTVIGLRRSGTSAMMTCSYTWLVGSKVSRPDLVRMSVGHLTGSTPVRLHSFRVMRLGIACIKSTRKAWNLKSIF